MERLRDHSNIAVLLLIEYTQIHHLEMPWPAIGVIASVGALLANVVTMWLFVRLARQEKEIAQHRALVYHDDMQRHHMGEADTLYRQIRVWRHDYEHHMQAIFAALQQNEVDQAKPYVGDFGSVPDYVESSKLRVGTSLREGGSKLLLARP